MARIVRAAAFLAIALAVTLWPGIARAFDPSIHENITESVLRARGFDEDSADEAGDSNYWTDTFEPNTAAAHADGNQLGAASGRLRDKMTAIGDALNACKRRDALDALGEAFHTVQDIFSHSNSIDNGHPVDLLNLVNGTAACNPPNFAPGGLVTGHFSSLGYVLGKLANPPNPRGQCLGTPANMCCHFDLNKDNGSAPNGARHAAARAAATGGTGDYLGFVEDDIRARFPPDERSTQLIKMLKRKQRTVMFVIDDTGSMSNDIAGVKAAANAFLDQLVAGDEAPTLGLVSFKDNVTNRGLTCNLAPLRAQINALFASGGGDCPEAMNSALLSAIATFPRGRSDIQIDGGRILLATDASARDPGLGPAVAEQAALRGISIDTILTGDCVAEDSFTALSRGDSSADEPPPSDNQAGELEAAAPSLDSHTGDPLTSPSARTYLRALTEQTGGVLFNVGRLEVDDVAPTLLSLSDPDTEVLLTRRVEPAPGSPVEVEVAVDDTLGASVTFMVTSSTAAGLPSVTLRRPSGAVVLPTDPDTTRRALSSVVTYRMQAPAPGLWRVTLEGSARAVVRVFGETSLRFNGLRYFTADAIPARPELDLAPLDGQPVAGSTLTAEARFTNAPGTEVAMHLRRSDGTLVQDPAVSSVDGRRFRATLVVPNETFLIELTGRTPAGTAFVRQFAVPVAPRLVGIRATPDVSVTAPGHTASIEIVVTNASSVRATYALEVSRTLTWPLSIPGAFSVEPGARATVTLGVTVPAGTAEGARNDLNVRVQDVAVAANRNNASVAVVAGPPNRPPECTAAAPSTNRLWPPNHAFNDVSVLGVTDPDGDPVGLTITRITQDEAVDAPGSGNTAPDGEGVGGPVARVRAERAGSGDGRVYAITFEAADGKGGTCTGGLSVGVPHSVHGTPVDSGQAYDSTVVP